MLLRDAHAAGFRVPEMPRRPIAPDDSEARRAEEALDERNARDERLADRAESARAHAHFVKRIAEAEAAGAVGEGFAKEIAKELRAYRSLGAESYAVLQAGISDRAIKAEARVRARDRILRVGQTIDTLVAAAKAAPENFAEHVAAAEASLKRLPLPEKSLALFRERLTDIPAASLAALAERAPAVAAALIKRRDGPAAARYGLSRTTLRLIAKQAEAAIANGELEQSRARSVDAARAHADASAAITAAGRGEAPETALTAWLPQTEIIGRRGTRELRKQSAQAAAKIARKKEAVALARNRLAGGEPLDNADTEGIDGAYAEAGGEQALAFVQTARAVPASLARTIVVRLKGSDLDAAAATARLVAELARDGLTTAIDGDAVREALMIDAAQRAGFPPAEAVRRVRGRTDLAPPERDRRARDFGRTANGRAIAALVEHLYGVGVAGIED